FFRDGVDGLALRANQLTDLGYWNLDRGDLRCQWRHLIWSVNALGHDVQDLFAGIACLRQSISQYLGWDAKIGRASCREREWITEERVWSDGKQESTASE